MAWFGGGSSNAAAGILERQVKIDSLSAEFSFDVSGIPAEYDLLFSGKVRQTTGTLGNIVVTFNTLGGTNYTQSNLRVATSGGVVLEGNNGLSRAFMSAGLVADTTSDAGAWSYFSFKTPQGWGSGADLACIMGEAYTNVAGGSAAARTIIGGNINNIVTVTSVEIGTNQGNFLVDSAATLYAVPAGVLG